MIAAHNRHLECSVAQALGILRDALCPADPGRPLSRDSVSASLPAATATTDDGGGSSGSSPLTLTVTREIGFYHFRWPLVLPELASSRGGAESRISQAEFLRAQLAEPLLQLCDSLGSALQRLGRGPPDVALAAGPLPGLGQTAAALYSQLMMAKRDIPGIVRRTSSFGGQPRAISLGALATAAAGTAPLPGGPGAASGDAAGEALERKGSDGMSESELEKKRRQEIEDKLKHQEEKKKSKKRKLGFI